MCTKVLPSVMSCLIDRGSVAVREAAFACVETYMIKLKEVSERMQVEEEERKRAEVRLASPWGGVFCVGVRRRAAWRRQGAYPLVASQTGAARSLARSLS